MNYFKKRKHQFIMQMFYLKLKSKLNTNKTNTCNSNYHFKKYKLDK